MKKATRYLFAVLIAVPVGLMLLAVAICFLLLAVLGEVDDRIERWAD